MNNSITNSKYTFPNQTNVYHGKVRDVYTINTDLLVMVASDRISAFDHILPAGIPYKGQVLNQIASWSLKQTVDIVPNWLQATPHPMVSVGLACQPFKVEMVVRGYLAGHAAREYAAGKRIICGVELPNGLKENDKLPKPIITPTTKADQGHDEDISKEEILKQNIVSEKDYTLLEKYALALFERGTTLANEKGLILVDTKYEFGKYKNEIYLIDEIHTPDSSRYFYAEGYLDRQNKNLPQKQLSKEFVREWLMENGFQGLEGQEMPVMPADFIALVSERYIELYENIVGEKFDKLSANYSSNGLEQAVLDYLDKL